MDAVFEWFPVQNINLSYLYHYRKVPAYSNFVNERFERCLDLYLAPRARIMRLTIQPEDLIPQLPKPKDLMPFPTACSLTFK